MVSQILRFIMAGQEAKGGLELPHVTEGVQKLIAEISAGTCLEDDFLCNSTRFLVCFWSQVPAGSIIIGT